MEEPKAQYYELTTDSYQQNQTVMSVQRNLHVLNDRSRCVNVLSGHSKGHQTASGIVFAAGEYQSAFTYEGFRDEFHNLIYYRLEWLMRLLEERIKRGEEDIPAANNIHQEETLRSFYADIFQDNATFQHSHSLCLGCLFDRPEHTLPCGHMLCSGMYVIIYS